MESIEVLVSELRSVGSANFQFTVFAALDGLTVGWLISTAYTLATVTFTDQQIKTYLTFVVMFLVSLIATLVFTAFAIYFGFKSRKQTSEILESDVEKEEA